MAKKDYSSYSKDELIKEVQKLAKRKRYGIVWEDKPENVAELCKEKLPVLEEDKGKEIKSNGNEPMNILIEGDNYHALSVLNYTHKGKIDVIYIDPPYNTGAKDWKYNNDYVDINDLFRHSKWLSLMYHRLRLAKPLLKTDGIFIVTIDDNELFHLGTLLEELFPSYDLFIVTIEHNKRGRRGKNFAKTNEWAIFLIPKGQDLIQEEFAKGLGGETRNLRRTGSGSKRTERPKKFYPIWVDKDTLEVVSAGDPIPVNSDWKYEEKGNLVSIWPIDEDGREKNWHYGVVRTRTCIDNGTLKARKQGYGIQIYYTLRKKDSKKYKTVWTGSKYDASTYGSVLLESILGEPGQFDYPKSLYAVLECMRATVGTKKNAIILDYFAGSGTTGHAVLELNKEDGGQRKFILCTNNENNIAEGVTYPRIKKVIKGYPYSGPVKTVLFEEKISIKFLKEIDFAFETIDALEEKNKGIFDKCELKFEKNFLRLYGIKTIKEKKDALGGNLRYYRTDFVEAAPTDRNKKKLVDKSTEMLCLKEDCFDEFKAGKNFRLFKNVQGKHLGIIYDDEGIEPFKKELQKLNKQFVVYVFSLDESAREEEFGDVAGLVELKPIPAVILNVYRRIFRCYS